MRGRSEEGLRPPGLRLGAGLVERVDGRAEQPRVAPDFVERHQPVKAVERGVLHALRHHWASELLEAHDQLGLDVSADAEHKEVAQEVQ
jgi:hypothetical protein